MRMVVITARAQVHNMELDRCSYATFGKENIVH